MKPYLFCVLLAALMVVPSGGTSIPENLPTAAAVAARTTDSFDSGWRFMRGEASGAERPEFQDEKWRTLNLPHDWSIEGPFDPKNTTGGAGGFLPAGIGWYRKYFTLPAETARRRVFIEFDGIMANSDAWINGAHLGKRPYGYVSFRYELTPHLRYGPANPNVLAVRVDTAGQPASRWYTGAGIYRHVRLIATNPIHIGQWATFITTPQVTAAQARVQIVSAVVNQSDTSCAVKLHIAITAPDGRVAAAAESGSQTIDAGRSVEFRQDVSLKDPRLWDVSRPTLYRALIQILADGVVLDDENVPFGIREARFEPDTGFWLNGKNLKIKGVCLHHDGGAFGAAVPLRVWERRLERLRELGVNAIRTAHNPPAPEFLDLCDRMGFLVMDEMFDCWEVAKNPHDYHLYFDEWSKIDTRDTVLRDRNHPGVILYSTGNEIRDTPNAEPAKRILAGLIEVFHRLDPTRPVTQGLFRPNVSHDYDNGLADLLDVIGTNYRDSELLAAHQAKLSRRIIGTEQRHDRQTWLAARDNAPHAGQFLWSGIDYLGESPQWPIIAAGSGLLDRTGEVKPMAYERQSWWSDRPVVHIVRRTDPVQTAKVDPGFEPLIRRQSQFADWTPQAASAHEETVEAYSNCDEVELFLNRESLGTKLRNADDAPRIWKVPYQAGTLAAIGRNSGKTVASHELRTAGKPAKIVLAADRTGLEPGWDEVAHVTVTVTDQEGNVVPGASHIIRFRVSGPGILAAVDNGDNASSERFQASERRAYQGRCIAVIRAGASRGAFTLAASAQDLAGSSITIQIVAPSGERR